MKEHKETILKLILLVFLLLAIRLVATEKESHADFCWFDTIAKEIRCIVYKTNYYGGVNMLTEKQKEIHSQRLLIKAEKNLVKRRALHSYLAKLMKEYKGISDEMTMLGDSYLVDLRKLESKIKLEEPNDNE